MKKVDYHRTLAEYFLCNPLYLDEALREKPNIRKIAEQPWQQIEGELRNYSIETLCSLLFIDAKVKAGMLRQLKSDFEKARGIKDNKKPFIQACNTDVVLLNTLLNLNESERETLPEKPAYKSGEIIDYKYIKDDPEIINNIKRIIDAESGITDIMDHKNDGSVIEPFYIFITSQGHLLEKMPEETLAIAYNYSRSGVVAQQAGDLLKRIEKPWISNHPRPSTETIFPLCRFIMRIPAHYSKCIALSKESNILISGGTDCLIRTWDINTGNQLAILYGHSDSINSVAISNNGTIALSAGDDRTLKVWDITSNKCLHTLKGHTESIRSVSLSADGDIAASTSDDGTVRIWCMVTGDCKNVIEETNGINSVILVSEGRLAYTCNNDETIRAWDTQTGKCLRILHGHGYIFGVPGFDENEYFRGASTPVINIDYAQEGRLAISCSYDLTVRVWDMISGKCLRVLEYENRDVAIEPHYGHDTDVSITRDGRIVAAGRENNVIQVWDASSGTKLRMLEGHTARINNVIITANGETVISSSLDGTIRIWDIVRGVVTKQTYSTTVRKFIYPFDNLCTAANERIKIFINSKYFHPIWTLHPYYEIDTNIHFDKSSIILQDTYEKRELRVLKRDYRVIKIILIPDDRYLISMNKEENDNVKIHIWDIIYGICIKTHYFSNNSWLIDQTPDGKALIIDKKNAAIQIIHTFSGERNLFISKKENLVSASVSPNGRHLASVTKKGQIILWEISSGTCLYTIQTNKDSFQDIVFSADGKYIITSERDETLRIWEVRLGKKISSYSPGMPVNIRSGMTPDGHIECGWENKVRYYKFHNVSFDAPVITPFRHFTYNLDSNTYCQQNKTEPIYVNGETIPGQYGETISFKCPWCHNLYALPDEINKIINNINIKHHIEEVDSPCLKLTPDAWEEPGLASCCPVCQNPIKFNPYIIDNYSRDRYASQVNDYGKIVRLLNERSIGANELFRVNFGIGCLCRRHSLIEEAINYFEKVIRQWVSYRKIQLKIGQEPEKDIADTAAGAYNEIAFLKFTPLKDWNNAETYYTEAINLFKDNNNYIESVNSELNLHLMYHLSGKTANRKRVAELINILEQHGDKRAAKGKELFN